MTDVTLDGLNISGIVRNQKKMQDLIKEQKSLIGKQEKRISSLEKTAELLGKNDPSYMANDFLNRLKKK